MNNSMKPAPRRKPVQVIDAQLARVQARLKILQEQRQAVAGDPPSRQRLWQRRQVKAGLCGQCGHEKISHHSKSFGVNCLAAQARRKADQRKKDGFKTS